MSDLDFLKNFLKKGFCLENLEFFQNMSDLQKKKDFRAGSIKFATES